MAEPKLFRGQPAEDPDALLERFLEVFVERLVVGVLARVDQRLEHALAERSSERAAVDVATAAERLGISQRGVARLLASGKLPSLRVRRRRLILLQALEQLVTNGSSEPIAPPEPRRLPRRR